MGHLFLLSSQQAANLTFTHCCSVCLQSYSIILFIFFQFFLYFLYFILLCLSAILLNYVFLTQASCFCCPVFLPLILLIDQSSYLYL